MSDQVRRNLFGPPSAPSQSQTIIAERRALYAEEVRIEATIKDLDEMRQAALSRMAEVRDALLQNTRRFEALCRTHEDG